MTEKFQFTAVLTLNFDTHLSKVNSDSWRRCSISEPNEPTNQPTNQTNKQTNKQQICLITIPPCGGSYIYHYNYISTTALKVRPPEPLTSSYTAAMMDTQHFHSHTLYVIYMLFTREATSQGCRHI